MSSKIPALSAREIIRALRRAGFREERQKGSHLIFKHEITGVRTVVPVHSGKTIKKPLLRAIIEDAKLSVDEFLELL